MFLFSSLSSLPSLFLFLSLADPLADIDEKALSRLGGGSQAVTARIARAKAQALLDRIRALEPPLPPSFLITSDQVVVHKGTIREKPESMICCWIWLCSFYPFLFPLFSNLFDSWWRV